MAQTLLMLNMSYQRDWERGIVNRNYHVLQALRRTHRFDRIISVDFLPFSAKKRWKVLLQQRPWQKQAHTMFASLAMRIDADPAAANFFHVVATSGTAVAEAVRRLQVDPAHCTVWLYDPLAIDAVDLLPGARLIFDAVDNWLEHPAYQQYQERLVTCYKKIQQRATAIFTVSESLLDVFGRKENVFFVPNGVDSDHFVDAACATSLLPKTIIHPIIGYHGVIQSRVNTAIIEYVAAKHPDYSFVLAGPVWKDMKSSVTALQKYPNVFVLGPVPYQTLPTLLACFDVAWVPHKIDTLTQSMNPLKLYEYLAAGKPIVSTPVAGTDQFQDLIQLAISPEDFSSAIQLALAQDSPALRSRRQAMAAACSWPARVQLMLDILKKLPAHDHE